MSGAENFHRIFFLLGARTCQPAHNYFLDPPFSLFFFITTMYSKFGSLERSYMKGNYFNYSPWCSCAPFLCFKRMMVLLLYSFSSHVRSDGLKRLLIDLIKPIPQQQTYWDAEQHLIVDLRQFWLHFHAHWDPFFQVMERNVPFSFHVGYNCTAYFAQSVSSLFKQPKHFQIYKF